MIGKKHKISNGELEEASCIITTPFHVVKAIFIDNQKVHTLIDIEHYICHCGNHFSEMDITKSCLVLHSPDEYCATCPKCNKYTEGTKK